MGHTTQSRYGMILKKYGWNELSQRFTKKVNVNEIMKLSDELCAVHLSAADMANSSSKLLWSNKAEKTMVITPKGKDVLKRHRMQTMQQRNANRGRAASNASAPPAARDPPQSRPRGPQNY